MGSDERATHPAEEMLRLWQMMVVASMDAMIRSMTVLAPGVPVPGGRMALQEQVERAVRTAMESTTLGWFPIVTRLSEEVSLLRAQTEALSTGLATLHAALQLQQQGWKTLETIVQQTASTQEDVKRTVEGWGREWTAQVGAMTRGMDEWRQRWEQMLREGMAAGQASQKGLEDLAKTMWDVAKKMSGGTQSSPSPRAKTPRSRDD